MSKALGRAYAQVGRYQDALPHLEAATKDDEDGDAHYQLARTLQALGRTADAEKALAEFQRRRQRNAPRETGAADKPLTLTPPK